MKKVNVLVLGLAVLLAMGCKEENAVQPQNDPANATTQTGCVPVKIKNYEVYGAEDRDLIYNAHGQITKVTLAKSNTPTQFELITYSATGKITWIRRYSLPAKQLTQKTQFFYNADSVVSKEVLHFPATPGDSSSFRPTSEYNYDYDAAKRLTKISQSPYQSATVYSYTNYTYGPNNMLTEEVYAGSPIYIIWRRDIQYLPNGKAPGSNLAYFNLPPRASVASDGTRFGLMPVTIISTQHLMGAPVAQHTFNYSYVFNAEGYPTEQIMTFPGQQPLTNYWTYNCQ